MTDGLGTETYSYDNIGRMTGISRTVTGAAAPYNIGYGYNESGQLTSITYPSGRVVQQNYDPLGRLSSILSGATTTYIYSGSQVLAEYPAGAAPTAPSKEYVYVGGKLLATIVGGATTYQYPDQLSTRVETDSAGNVTRTFGHLPFGEVWYETGTPSKWKFTSYERDTAEPQLDYAMNRFYAYGFGRFQSPDTYMGSMDPTNPQSMNRYAYVMNIPTALVDPLGLAPKFAEPDNVDLRFSEFEFLDILFEQIDSTGGVNAEWVPPAGVNTVATIGEGPVSLGATYSPGYWSVSISDNSTVLDFFSSFTDNAGPDMSAPGNNGTLPSRLLKNSCFR